jgi:hypothetical protein
MAIPLKDNISNNSRVRFDFMGFCLRDTPGFTDFLTGG